MSHVLKSEADSSLTYIYGINTLLSMMLGSVGSGPGRPQPEGGYNLFWGDAAHTDERC